MLAVEVVVVAPVVLVMVVPVVVAMVLRVALGDEMAVMLQVGVLEAVDPGDKITLEHMEVMVVVVLLLFDIYQLLLKQLVEK